jgi:hypothetical protein
MRTTGGKVARGRWGRSLVGGSLSEAFPVARVAVLGCCTMLVRVGLRPGAVYSSADETVAAVRVLTEDLCLPAGIPSPVLGEEDAVRVIRPPWAGTSHISGPKGLRKITAGDSAADVVHQPMHEVKYASHGLPRIGDKATDAVTFVDLLVRSLWRRGRSRSFRSWWSWQRWDAVG